MNAYVVLGLEAGLRTGCVFGLTNGLGRLTAATVKERDTDPDIVEERLGLVDPESRDRDT